MSESKRMAARLRELAEECADRIDGAEESRGHDVWLSRLIDGFQSAAELLESGRIGRDAVAATLDQALNSGDGAYRP